MRVLLTGASGFIGQHCLEQLLNNGHQVYAIARNPLSIPGPIWKAVDLLSPGAPSQLISTVKPEAVLHLAWCTTPETYWSSPENLLWLQSSLELLTAIANSGCRRVVMVGTCAEYDWTSGVCSEDRTALQPATLYGMSKLSLFNALQRFAGSTDLSWCWTRVFYVYGPHEHPKRLIPSVITSLLHGHEPRISIGEEARDLLHVADVASALVAVLQSSLCGPVNIGSASAVRLRDVVVSIARKLDRPELIRFDTVSTAVPSIVAENKILGSTGWRPRYTTDSGLDQTISWWRHITTTETTSE